MKGIREYVNARFAEFLPQLGELGGTKFRKTVMEGAVQAFGTSVASAATHYNHALKEQRKNDPKSVEGLGRPEGKKGGRKPIHTVDVIKVKGGEVVATGLSRAAAEEMIKKAADAKKAKLMIKEPEVAPETPAGEAAPEHTPGMSTNSGEFKFPKAADFEQPAAEQTEQPAAAPAEASA